MSDYDDMNNEGFTPEENIPENSEANEQHAVEVQPESEPAQQSVQTENKNPYSQGNGYGQYNPQQPVNPYSQQGYYQPPHQTASPQQGYYPPYAQQQQQGRVNYVYNGNGYQQPAAPSAPRVSKGRKKGRRLFFAIMSVLVVVALVFTGVAIGRIGKGKTSDSNKTVNDAPVLEIPDGDNESAQSVSGTKASSGEMDPREIYQKVKDASVGVLVSISGYNAGSGEGSGVVVGEDESGKYTYIITCAHVVSDGNEIKVQLADETQYPAILVGSDARTDIAVLRIAKTGLTAIEIGDSDSLEVGETVYAIGNPGGVEFAGSFTNGMISSIARPISSEIGYQMTCIQHTAAINPGNSGGALVNAKGQLIGINSSKIASTDYEGMGFAVPSATFVTVYNEIIKNGYVANRPKLGIRYVPATSNSSYAMLVGANNLPSGSIIIASIDVDSSLASQDVKTGDVIIKCNGVELEDTDYLPDLVEKSKVGDSFTLTIVRFDSNYKMTQFEVTATLVEDKGVVSQTVEETTTQANPYYNFDPFEFFGGGGN